MRAMSPSLKAVLALIFVAVLGTVLIRPILDAADAPLVAAPADEPSPRRSKRTTASPTPESSPSRVPSPAPSTSSEGGLISGPFRTQPLFDRYPKACLRSAAPAGEIGAAAREDLIASVNGGRITFGTTAGPTQLAPGGTTFGKVDALVGINRTGDLYAARSRSGAVLLSPPEGLQGADGDSGLPRLTTLVWSPQSGCGVAIARDGSLLVLPYDGSSRLARESVTAASFSPDGRRLALVLEEGETTSLWVADLDGTKMQEVQRERTGPRVDLKGWSPDGRTLYVTFAPGSGLSFVSFKNTSAPPLRGGVVAAPVTSLEVCGTNRSVGVVNGAIAAISTRGPDYLTETKAGYTAVSCEPNGSFMAAIRDGDLVLLDGDGSELRDLTLDLGFKDIYVDWGDGGSGVLFGRVPAGGGAAQLWHIPEGGTARNTGLTFTPGPGAVDWNASPPTGIPVLSSP
jgi:hypothetical protein